MAGLQHGADHGAAPADLTFVGRERELKLLLDVFARARAGSAQLVTLLGEAGIGKTRLAHEFAKVAQADALIVRAPWTQRPETVPYAPLLRALRHKSVPGAPDPEADLSRDEALLALLGVGEAMLGAGPSALILDNFHWADDAALDLFDQALDRFRDAPLMLLCLAQDELLERRPGWAGGRPNSMTLALHPLPDELAAELAAGLDERSRDWVVQAAEGNPLFIEELMTYVRDQGLPETGELPPPPTLQAIIGARLGRLDEAERAVLQAAAIAGRTFEAAPVEALHGAPVEETLQSLARRDLLREWRGGYVFQHQLLLEVVYRSIPKERLADLHRRLADWYEETGGADAMALRPMHLYRAYAFEPDPALRRDVARSLTVTGKRMSARGNVRAAIAAFERAVDLVEGDERLPLLYELANAQAEAGEVAAAQRVLRDAEEQAALSGDRRAQLLVMLARSDANAINSPSGGADAEQAAREAIAEFEALGDPLGLSRAWERLRLVHSYACRSADALDAAERALAYAREAGSDEDVLRLLPVVAAQHYWGPTPVDVAIPELERILSDLGSHPSGRGSLLWMLGGLHAMRGELDEGRRLYREASELNLALGRTIRDASVTQVGAAIELLARDPRAAERELLRGRKLLEQAGETAFRSSVTAWLGRARAAQGRFAEAAQLGTTALELGASEDEVTNTIAHALLAETYARGGDPDASDWHAERLREVIGAIDEPIARADAVADLAVAAAVLGREAEADALAAEADALYAAKGSSAGRALLSERRTTATAPG